MRDLTAYRLETAQERLEVSKEMIESGRYRISVTNSYYAIFNAVRALLAEEQLDFKKHSAVVSYFRREYVNQYEHAGEFCAAVKKYLEQENDNR